LNVCCNGQGSKISNSKASLDSTVILNGNQIILIDGFDVSKYELEIDYLEFDYKELTIDHIFLCCGTRMRFRDVSKAYPKSS